MNKATPFQLSFPLQDLPDLSEEVFFAYNVKVNEVVYLNAAFEKIWDIPPESINANISLLLNAVHPDDKEYVRDSFKTLIKEGKKLTIEFRISILPAGRAQKWIKLNAYISRKNEQELIIGMASDVTATKDYSDTLHKFSDKKNSTLQMLSHDLMGSLGNIQLSSAMLLENDMLKSDASLAELIKLIQRNSKRSVALIRDLIDDEFLQSSEASIKKQRVDIVESIRRSIDQFRQTSQEVALKRFSLISSLDSLFITIDESKFMQAIINLLSNALKFTTDTGSIDIHIEDLGKNLMIKVIDNGIGIPEDLQPYVFDKFTKARRIGLKGEHTTGLGMSIIKRIVEWHNGRIWFESVVDKGTTFFIEIPKEN